MFCEAGFSVEMERNNMAIRSIVTEKDEILRKVSRPVTVFDDRLHTLLDDMAQTMYKADGAGLAAVQVGVLRRVVVIDAGDGLIEMVNPVIVATSGVQEGPEGCLSFPGEHGIVRRANYVKATAQDRNGNPISVEGTELLARAIQHECDHLDGKVFKDIVIEMLDD